MRHERMVLRCGCFVLAMTAAGLANRAVAQPYPRQLVRIIVPFAAGGGTDSVARLIAQRLSDLWKQPVVVDNRAGGNTIIGTEAVAKAKPDGYTLLVAVAAHTINCALYPRLPYNTATDFAPVTLLSQYPFALAMHPSLPVKSVADLIALAKARPGEMSYASSGIGSINHLGFELFKSMAGGINIVHVPYKGGAAANVDLAGGHVQLFLSNIVETVPLSQAGRLRALAVTSIKRSPVMPAVPTIAESGVTGFDVIGWNGALVPAATPETAIAKLQTDIASVLRIPEVAAKLSADGSEPGGNTPEQFAKFLQGEMSKWAKVVNAIGIKAE